MDERGELLGRFQIPWDPARFNPNTTGKRHHMKVHQAAKAGKNLALMYWRQQRLTLDCRILVQFTVYRSRRMDADNCSAGLKPIRDGLFKRNANNGEGVVPDDGSGWIEELSVIQETAASYKRDEWTVVEIWRAPNQEPLKNAPKLSYADRDAGFVPFRG